MVSIGILASSGRECKAGSKRMATLLRPAHRPGPVSVGEAQQEDVLRGLEQAAEMSHSLHTGNLPGA